ncbi:MAG TPA: EAL domain-containing protein [Coleofasciculaceae cyanobacterium]
MHQPSILIIDDEPENFDVIEALLPEQGYVLHYASSGQAAIDSLEIFQPDVILLDVMMPGLDGIEVCQRIKAMPQWQVAPIIMVTALSTKEDLARCFQAGADDFISKPVSGIELRARVHSMLRIKQQYDDLQTSLQRQAVLEAEKVELLESRNSELEKQVEQRTAALRATAEREQLIAKVASQIRSSLNLSDILDTTVQKVQSLLGCDRVSICRFQPDWSVVVVSESIANGNLSNLGKQFYDPCFDPVWLESHRQGSIRVVPDIDTFEMSDCYRQLLRNLQIRAKILVPIIQGDTLWGWLNAIESHAARQWQPEEISLLQQLSIQVAIAIQQATAYQLLQTELAERQRAESHLRESEQRYATLAAAAPVGIFCTDTDGNCFYVNHRWCAIAGLTAEESVGQGWMTGLHPEDRDRITTEWYESVQEKRSFRLEYRFQQSDGTVVWVFGQTVAERDSDGQITGYVGTITDITELKQAQELIIYNALYDPLTDLPNRTLLVERLQLAINRARRVETYRYAVLFLDLDRFKVINDSLGHLVGDQILKSIAQKLKTYLRAADLVARLGGDEFVILLEDIAGLEEVIQITERILADCQIPLTLNEYEMSISTSIGIVLSEKSYRQASDLIRDADIAMYQAKAQGRSSYKIFDADMHTIALKRLTLESDFRKALEREEFIVYYQPIVDISGDRLFGFEALVRWQHPTRGFISPAEFIPIAEETGLIVPLDSWVFRTACQQLGTWKAQYAARFPLKVSINLSAQDLRKASLIEDIDRVLAETGLEGDSIALEITESMLIEDINRTIDLLDQLKARKIRISIDDFGTGYSSLNYLHRFPADNLKIDRSFVGQMLEGNRNYQVVSTIITLSNQLGLAVVAEGIETPQQLQWLRQLGCELGQGYLFSKPLAAHEIEDRFFKEHYVFKPNAENRN